MQDYETSFYQEVANAIVIQATKDYRNALAGRVYKSKSPEEVVRECEEFFRSDYYSRLTKVSGEYLIEQLRKEVKDERQSNPTDP